MQRLGKQLFTILSVIILAGAFQGCSSGVSKDKDNIAKPLALPIHTISRADAITVKDYLGTIEGKVNVDIRPQVEGILQEIYVDEGAYVSKGQKLFKIDQSTYQESLNNMLANLQVAKAKLENAQLEIDRLKPLVANDVISPVKLASAKSDYQVAKATVDQAAAAVRSAEINKGFTIITAPVSGYIGRLPKRIGNLVSKSDKDPLTYLSDIQEVYVYFSMSESDYLFFSKAQALQDSIAGKVYNQHNRLTFPEVSLILADGEGYEKKGTVDAVNGQVDRATGAISLRATFQNHENILRSGSSGTLKVTEIKKAVIQVPQIATNELQDRTFVYVLDEHNKVQRKNIKISGKTKANYIVADGLNEGDRILTSGFDKLTDGSVVTPI